MKEFEHKTENQILQNEKIKHNAAFLYTDYMAKDNIFRRNVFFRNYVKKNIFMFKYFK